MALFWLCYRKSGRVSVAIIEAPSLMHARMRAALDGMNARATFAEGHNWTPIMPRGGAAEPGRNDALSRRSCGVAGPD
jgi:hypothetical protein